MVETNPSRLSDPQTVEEAIMQATAALEQDPTLAQIVEAASEQFIRYGYRKTTMEDIAKAAGKGKSSLYYYFKNKEEIFKLVVIRHSNEITRQTEAAVNQAASLREQLVAVVETRAEILYQKHGRLSTIREEMPELIQQMPWMPHFAIERVERHFCQLFREIFSRANQRGEVRQLSEHELELIPKMFSFISMGMELPMLMNMPMQFIHCKLLDVVDCFCEWVRPTPP